MKPRFCKVIHNPPESYGDCVQACLATLVDDDNIPHVHDDRSSEQCWADIRAYLATKGKNIVTFGIDDLEHMKDNNPDIPYMLIGERLGGGNHAVVAMNDKIIHDPALVPMPLRKIPDVDAWLVFIVI